MSATASRVRCQATTSPCGRWTCSVGGRSSCRRSREIMRDHARSHEITRAHTAGPAAQGFAACAALFLLLGAPPPVHPSIHPSTRPPVPPFVPSIRPTVHRFARRRFRGAAAARPLADAAAVLAHLPLRQLWAEHDDVCAPRRNVPPLGLRSCTSCPSTNLPRTFQEPSKNLPRSARRSPDSLRRRASSAQCAAPRSSNTRPPVHPSTLPPLQVVGSALFKPLVGAHRALTPVLFALSPSFPTPHSMRPYRAAQSAALAFESPTALRVYAVRSAPPPSPSR